ncbi:MAG: hypothetical protein H6672_12630 [Anaerolineaceae bacterium]|nr:hypothetical protein [Anaerolineaceae bacterium]
MSTPPQPSTEQVVQAIYQFAAGMMKQGTSEYRIEQALIEKGLTKEAARTVVGNLSRLRRETVRKAAQRNMMVGGAICVIGLVVTILSYNAAAASPTGGRYIIAWGAVIFGAIQFFRGLSANGT